MKYKGILCLPEPSGTHTMKISVRYFACPWSKIQPTAALGKSTQIWYLWKILLNRLWFFWNYSLFENRLIFWYVWSMRRSSEISACPSAWAFQERLIGFPWTWLKASFECFAFSYWDCRPLMQKKPAALLHIPYFHFCSRPQRFLICR